MNRRPPQMRERDPREHPRERTRIPAGERRTRNRRKPNVWGTLRLLAMTLLLAEGLRVAFWSPRLSLREVKLTGSTRYSAADLVRMGQIPVGRNIFGVNLARVHDRLLKDPVLGEVEVTRDFPDRLLISVVERVPALQITGAGKVLHADREGVVFQTAPAARPELPTVELPGSRCPKLGDRLDPELNRAAWQCVGLARKEGLTARKLRVDGNGELWLHIVILDGAGNQRPAGDAQTESAPRTASAGSETAAPALPADLPVRLGRPTELAEKLRDVRMTLEGAPQVARATYLDVMSAGNPFFKIPDSISR